jgi:secreted PhoX family phosphatase
MGRNSIEVNDCFNGETIDQIIHKKIARRTLLKSAVALPLISFVSSFLHGPSADGAEIDQLRFLPIALNNEDRVLVAPGYSADVLIRWGDPLLPGAPQFDLSNQTAAAQAMQFGYNCDFVHFFPLGSKDSAKRGILAINHEYTNPELMFPDYDPEGPTKNQVDVQLAAHGLAFLEVEFDGTKWRWLRNSRYNRRITGETEMTIHGHAAGDALLKSSYDSTGKRVRGTLNNCGGGVTPWGTLLTAEENFNQYFANRNSLSDSDPRKAMHARYGIPAGSSERRWENHHARFDLKKESNEPFRFGWVVEIDPYNPTFTPRKRTALGRMKHEAATVVVAPDRRVVAYTGDDERFDYVYKFVTNKRMSQRREDNFSLLDEGTLYVARFDLNSSGNGIDRWIPLVAGQGPLAGWSEALVRINTRGAADLMGATKMDRPEDIETNPLTGKVYVVCTNYSLRGTPGQPGTDPANAIAKNAHGHIIEIIEENNDPVATHFSWDVFMRCGDPGKDEQNTYFAGCEKSKVSALSCPDNIIFDRKGNLWIATDGQPSSLKRNDGIYAVPVQGPDRGYVRQFLSGVVGAEVASLAMTPDDKSLFASIQHPGEGSKNLDPANLTSRWPDGDFPKPSIIVVTKADVIGT